MRPNKRWLFSFAAERELTLYLFLCLLGIILTYSQFIPFLLENGINIQLAGQQFFANRVSGFFMMDVTVSAAVLIVFILAEKKREKVRREIQRNIAR